MTRTTVYLTSPLLTIVIDAPYIRRRLSALNLDDAAKIIEQYEARFGKTTCEVVDGPVPEQTRGYYSEGFDRQGRPCRMFVPVDTPRS